MPTQVDWPTPRDVSCHTAFVSQSPTARNDANVSLLVNVTGRNADAAAAMRIFPFARRDEGRDNSARSAAFCIALQRTFHAHHVTHRNAFRDGDDEFRVRHPRLQESHRRRRAGGTNTALAVAPVCFTASATVSKIGTFLPPCSKNCPPLPGVTPATTCVP